MPSGRKQVSRRGVDRLSMSWKYDSSIVFDRTKPYGSAQVGLAVTLKSNDTVGLVADAEFVLGKLELVDDDGFCTVEEEGEGVEFMAGTGADLTLGRMIVGALLAAAKGYVRAIDPTVLAEVAKGQGRIMNNADTTAVVVDMS